MSIAPESLSHSSASHGSDTNGSEELDLKTLISALTALRKGDFSTRLPTTWTGLSGKVGDIFNEVMDHLEGHDQRVRSHQPRRRQGRENQATGGRRRVVWILVRIDRICQCADQRLGASDQRNGPRHRRRGQRRFVAIDGLGPRRPAAGRGILAHRRDGQSHGRSARLVRLGSDARGPRSRHRRQTRRAGRSERRRRHLERPHR